MILDSQTVRDLEIFEPQSPGKSLFDLCNLTRTTGGAAALRRRMERPWPDAEGILSTQDALTFILEHRRAFNDLPAVEFTTSRVERYGKDLLELITYENTVEFGFGIMLLCANRSRDYGRIVRGAQITCRFIRGLRDFVRHVEVSSPSGELTPLLEEMRTLLARPRFARIPDQDIGSLGAWRVLRIDQVFRLHEKKAIARLLELTYETDALVALADVTCNRQFILPGVEEGALRVKAEGLVHPLVADAVANTVRLDQNRRLLFLTGPNMAGKTTYLRAVATALYMAHLGMGVPASSFSFVPAQRLFSSIAHRDDLRAGVSYFRAEALRVKSIAEAVASGYRVVAILDEPFKGTNVKDALDASFAILQRFAGKENCLFVFSSHLIELSERLAALTQVDCRYFEAEEREDRLRFEYRLRSGVSSQRLGMRLLREEGIFDLLDSTAEEP